MSALVLRGVRLVRGTGRQAVPVLRDVDLRLDPGEFVLLEGPSGSESVGMPPRASSSTKDFLNVEL